MDKMSKLVSAPKLANSIAELVGRTPIVKLKHATTENEGNVT